MSRQRLWSGWWVVGHLVAVSGLTALFYMAVWTTPSSDGANIGAGLLGLLLSFPLGLPWSPLVDGDASTRDGFSGWSRAVVDFGPAYLNVALHALFWRWRTLRRG